MPTACRAAGRWSASVSPESRALAVCEFVRVKTAGEAGKQRGFGPGTSGCPEDAAMNQTGNRGRLFSKTAANGLALLLLLSILPRCAARHMPYWSRVQAVAPRTKTEVQLYKNEAPPGSRKIKGRFLAATADSLTLTLKDGQTRTLRKQAVRKVLIRRPFKKRAPGWIALGVTLVVLAVVPVDSGDPRLIAFPEFHAMTTLPTAAAFFYGSRMKGIYEVPPKFRPGQGDKDNP